MAHPKVATFYQSLEDVEHATEKGIEKEKGRDMKALEDVVERQYDEQEFGEMMSSYGHA
jgi:hypothetical protein